MSKPTQSQILVELASDFDLFHTPEGDAYAWAPVGNHCEVWKIKNGEIREYLRSAFYREQNKPPSSQAMIDAVNVVEAKAKFDGPEFEVHLRVTSVDGNVYIDLADDEWRQVQVTPMGWEVITDSPVRFRRSRGMLPLPYPKKGGSICDLRPFINFDSEEDFVLIASYMVAAFRGRGPYPILVLNGEQGSAKSTTSRVIRSLIDPSIAPLRSPPKDARDLMIAARNSHHICFDNMSWLSQWLSDALCVLSTGGGLSTRELYTNDDEVLFDAVRPIILNGIEEIAVRGDLLDRSIVLMLPQIEEDGRKYESSFWCEFEEKRPAIFGALLDAVVEALGNVDMIELRRRPRMADFAQWSCAAAPAFGWSGDEFLSAYTRNRESSNTVALDSSLFASAIVDLVDQGRWEGTATELMKSLEYYPDESQKRMKGWPKTPKNASDALRRLAPNLRRAGVAVDFDRTARSRLIFLEKVENPAPSSFSRLENDDLASAQEQTWDDDSDISLHRLSSHMHLPASQDDVEHSQNDGTAKAASYAKSLKTIAYDDSDADDDVFSKAAENIDDEEVPF